MRVQYAGLARNGQLDDVHDYPEQYETEGCRSVRHEANTAKTCTTNRKLSCLGQGPRKGSNNHRHHPHALAGMNHTPDQNEIENPAHPGMPE